MRRSLAQQLVLAALVVALGACASPVRPPVRAPAVVLSLGHFQGTPMSGQLYSKDDPSLGRPARGPAREAWEVDVRVGMVRGLDQSSLTNLDGSAAMIAEPLSGVPLRAVDRTLGGVRVGVTSDAPALVEGADEWVDVDRLRGALDPGMTCVLGAVDPQGAPTPLQLLIHRPEGDDRVLSLLSRLKLDANGATREWELVTLRQHPTLDGDTLVVSLPDASSGDRMVIFVSLRTADRGDMRHVEIVGRARQQAQAGWDEFRDLLAMLLDGVPDGIGLADALAGISDGGNRRGATIYLADATGAAVTLDVAVSGRVELLETLGERLRHEPGVADASRVELAWMAERLTLAEIVRRVEEGEQDDPALEAMLIRHVGEVGRDLPLLLGLLDEAHDLEHLRKLLIEENLYFLDDSSPASRVRATDWLLSREVRVPGYRPLDGKGPRRAALNAYLDARDEPLLPMPLPEPPSPAGAVP